MDSKPLAPSEAGIVRCPNCGGDVLPGRRRCGYCRSLLQTIRCAYCYSMNDAEALHCSACGQELGLEPAPQPGWLACPRCAHGLLVLGDPQSGVHACEGCGGQFVEHAALRAMLEQSAPLTAVPNRTRAPANPLGDPLRYLPCPVCQQLMNRKNFGGESGVVVDVCTPHGTFFDAGELARVLAFVESGGLARARRHAEESRDRQAALRQAREQGLSVMLPHAPDPYPTADLVRDFLKFLQSVLAGR